MLPMLLSGRNPNPLFEINPGVHSSVKDQFFFTPVYCSQQNPKNSAKECRGGKSKTQLVNSVVTRPGEKLRPINQKSGKNGGVKVGSKDMMVLCGLGYYVNGFRGFPWLALNFHMAQNLNMHPSTLQLVQNSANLPMVAKPLYGILSDALYFSGAHRIPYISIGVLLQVVSWGSLALIPIASEVRIALMACVLLSNLGAAVTEVAKDALVAEYGQKNKVSGLQSYAFMASAIGGVLGNLLGGFFLAKTQQTKTMFLAFAAILVLQLTVSVKMREDSLGLPRPSNYGRESIPQIIRKQYSDLLAAIREENVLRPLVWLVSSIVLIPILSGSIFCYQTQCLNLSPTVIGLSKVTGQLLLLSFAILYDRLGKGVPLRTLAGTVQIVYAFVLLLDLVLVRQLNVQLGIANDVFVLCFSGLAETVAQFKLLPFHVHFASLAPPGCEGSLMSLFASALCLSSVFSGFLGIGLASRLGITSVNYSNLPFGILIQFVAALLPLCWIDYLPTAPAVAEKMKKMGSSKRRRRNRRVGRVLFDSPAVYSYRRRRETDLRR